MEEEREAKEWVNNRKKRQRYIDLGRKKDKYRCKCRKRENEIDIDKVNNKE